MSAGGAPRTMSGLGRRPGRNRICPISKLLIPNRQQPICWAASRPPRGDGKSAPGADAAAPPFACRHRAGEDPASLSPSAPIAAELRPIVQAFPDLALEAAFGRIVELLAA